MTAIGNIKIIIATAPFSKPPGAENRKELNKEEVEAVKSLLGTGKITEGKTSEKNNITIIIGKDY